MLSVQTVSAARVDWVQTARKSIRFSFSGTADLRQGRFEDMEHGLIIERCRMNTITLELSRRNRRAVTSVVERSGLQKQYKS